MTRQLFRAFAFGLIALSLIGCAPKLKTTQLTFRDPGVNTHAYHLGQQLVVSAQVVDSIELEKVFGTTITNAGMSAVKLVAHNRSNTPFVISNRSMYAVTAQSDMAIAFTQAQVIKTLNDKVIGKEVLKSGAAKAAGGALLGAVVGTAVGGVVGDSSRAAGRGAAVGALGGALAGGAYGAMEGYQDVPAHVRTEVNRVQWLESVPPNSYTVGLVFFDQNQYDKIQFVVETADKREKVGEATIHLLP
ncbi:hypothetical protein [Chrysiogenes arsenatis]|uniref:hypothetical protein n=1 Tax=Chrysiogenes arsenatis TaxID=309797 RepID=UPI0004154209|nr:hypothetical protein [Chrysiogenes arsenatis]